MREESLCLGPEGLECPVVADSPVRVLIYFSQTPALFEEQAQLLLDLR